MRLHGTLNFENGAGEPLCLGQNQFLCPIHIDITVRINCKNYGKQKRSCKLTAGIIPNQSILAERKAYSRAFRYSLS